MRSYVPQWTVGVLLLWSRACVWASQAQQIPLDLPGTNCPFDARLESIIKDLLAEFHVPGISVAVVDKGHIAAQGYGHAVLPDQRATADTLYFTASTTKAFTAAAAGMLVHDDENFPNIQWTTPISDLIPDDFVLPTRWASKHITIEDALSHRTGIVSHDLTFGRTGEAPSDVVKKMRHLPSIAEPPRTVFMYSNTMYAVVTDLIQTVLNQDLEDVLRERIWKPLGMLSTRFTIPTDGESKATLARGYYWHSEQRDKGQETAGLKPGNEQQPAGHGQSEEGRYYADVYTNQFTTVGDGATISSVNDYALWIKTLLDAADPYMHNASSPISTELYRDLVTARTVALEQAWPENATTFSPPTYALGWFVGQGLIQTLPDLQIITHSGGLTGFGTQVVMVPELGYGVVTMANSMQAGAEVGAMIAVRLLEEKVNGVVDSVPHEGFEKLQAAGARLSQAGQHSRRSTHGWDIFNSDNDERKPLPQPLSDFAGCYENAAYGTINITIGVDQAGVAVLEMMIFAETVEKEVLTHASGWFFDVKSYEPHGLGDIATAEGIVWQALEDEDEDWAPFAAFALGCDRTTIENLGIQLNGDQVDIARKMGEQYWRESMVFFQRV